MLGRGANCDVILPEASVSKEHAAVFCGPKGWRLLDLGSSNGTYVKGARMPEGLVMPIKAGGVEVWFSGYRAMLLMPDDLRKFVEGMLKSRANKKEGKG